MTQGRGPRTRPRACARSSASADPARAAGRARAAQALPPDRRDRRRQRDLRAGERRTAGAPRGAGGRRRRGPQGRRVPGRRGRAARGRRPARGAADRERRARCGPARSCSRAGRGSPKVVPRALAGRIFPTRQEVFFFGVPKGDTRFSAPALPTWIDFGAGLLRHARHRGPRPQGRERPPRPRVRPRHRRARVGARRAGRGTRVPGGALPGHARSAARRGARLPVREHLERRLRDRPPSRATRTCGCAAAAPATASSTAPRWASTRPSGC